MREHQHIATYIFHEFICHSEVHTVVQGSYTALQNPSLP